MTSLTRAEPHTLVFTEFDYIGRLGQPEDFLWFQVIDEALSQVGYRLEVRFEPGRRAIHSALKGSSDGLLFQSEFLGEVYPNLTRVDFLMSVTPFYLYGFDARERPVCKQKVGLLAGFDLLLEMMAKADDCAQFKKPFFGNYHRQLMMLLQSQRIDAVLAPVILEGYLQSLVDSPLQRYELSRVDLPLYMYLGEEHKHLAPQLAIALKATFAERQLDGHRQMPFFKSSHFKGLPDDLMGGIR